MQSHVHGRYHHVVNPPINITSIVIPIIPQANLADLGLLGNLRGLHI